ncbi:MAG: SPOR domain-containing protein, partial [Alphaproteobacteria bacterium]
AAPAPAPDLPGPRYVQIGMFAVSGNAERLRRQLEADGLAVVLRERSLGGRTVTRVLIGPAATAAELQRLLDAARQRGFADALVVRG